MKKQRQQRPNYSQQNKNKRSNREVSFLYKESVFIYSTIEAETQRLERKIEAESQAEVNKIEMDKQILAKESMKKMEEIENQIYLEKEKSKADAHYYKVSKMIEAE